MPIILAAAGVIILLAISGLLYGLGLLGGGPLPGRPSPTASATRGTVTMGPGASLTPAGSPSPPATTQNATLPVVPVTPLPSLPAVTATPPPLTAGPNSYDLLLIRRSSESLFVINTGPADLPLPLLRLGDGDGQLEGREWGLDVLKSNHCVAVWNAKGHPRPPENVDCTPDADSEQLTREGKEVFWQNKFTVYFDGSAVADCFEQREDRCSIHIPLTIPHPLVISVLPLLFRGE
jgi:hypothetical protein